MAIEPIEPTNTPNEGREIINDNFVDLDGRINEIDPDGLAWHFGTGAPLDTVGFDGDMYFATDTQTYYGPKDAGAWPLSGTAVNTPDASETVKGKAEIATQTETDTGTDDTRIVTPLKLANYSGLGSGGGASASETVAGIAEIATQTETNTGTDDARIVTPLKLAGRTATDTRAGVVELATDAETQTGTDTTRAITPANLSARSATETRSGVAEVATQTETDAGTDDTRIVTPLKAATRFLAKAGGTLTGFLSLHADPTSAMHAVTKQYADALTVGGASPASETVAGIAEIATQTETDTGTDDARIVTPLKLAGRGFERTANKGANNGYAGLTSSGYVDPTDLGSGTPSSSNYLRGDGTWNTVSGGSGFTPDWTAQTTNALFVARADGNPIEATSQMVNSPGNFLTATQIGTTTVRLIRFRLPKALSLAHFWVASAGVINSTFNFAIYRASDGVRMWYPGSTTSIATGWNDITTSLPVSLAASTDYWVALSAISTGTTSAFPVYASQPISTIFNRASVVSPLNGRSIGIPEQAEMSTTSGAMPSSLGTLNNSGAETNGFPFFFLEGTAS